MSTRCQITVVQEGMGYEEKVTMYHHCDGYPEHLIVDIVETYKKMMAPEEIAPGVTPFKQEWRAGRTGSVAAFLCATHPSGFEPEDSHELHGDIAFHYTLYVVNHKGGCVGDIPTWEVEIREPGSNFEATLGTMKVTTNRTPLEKLAKKYCKKQKATVKAK